MGSVMTILNAGNDHKVKQAQVDASRLIQASGNERSAAESALAGFAQSLGNQKRLNAAGKQDDALQRNIAKLSDSMVVGKFQDRIAAAEALGQVTAMAGAAGVGGSSIETYKRTMELRQAIGEESQARAIGADKINMSAQRGYMLQDAVSGQNLTTYVGNMDRTVYVDHQKLSGGLGAALALGTATYFGGAKAGAALADTIVGFNSMANGDQAGANRLFDSAASGALGALEGYSKTNGNPWGMSSGGGLKSLTAGWQSLSTNFKSMFSIGD